MNCFFETFKIWDRKIDLEEIDPKFTHGGTIGYRDSLLDFVIRLKFFRLPATLHVSAVKTTTDK